MNGTISLHYVYLYIDNFNAFYFRGWKWTCKWNAKDQSDVGFLFDWIRWTLVCFLWLIWKFGLCITFIWILWIFYSIYEIIIQNLWSFMNFWRDGWIKSREMAAILFSHSHKIQFIHKYNLKKWLNMHTDWNILHINERRLKPIYRRFSWNSHSYSKSTVFFLLLNGSCNRFNSYANFTHDSDHFMMQKYL